MGMALFTAARLLAPVQKLLRDCAVAAARRLSPPSRTMLHSYPAAQASHMTGPWPVPCYTGAAKIARPLRVVRVVDSHQGNRGTGRMVISGRMADVCAELDRLVACESRGS